MNRKLIIDLSNKLSTSKKYADQSGIWRPEEDVEGKNEKHFTKGEKFPLYKGRSVPWRLVARD